MNDIDLKEKITEWLELCKEVKELQKAIKSHIDPIKHPSQIQQKPANPQHIEKIKAYLQQKKIKKADKPAMPTAHIWDKGQQPRLTATGFLPKYKPQPKVQPPIKKTSVSPALVSAPIIENRVDHSSPATIDQPNIINPYKDIFNSLKNKKGK